MATTLNKWGLALPQNGDAAGVAAYNKLLKLLDALMNIHLADTRQAPPVSFNDGEVYMVQSPGSGNWLNEGGKFAVAIDGSWEFVALFNGMIFADEFGTTKVVRDSPANPGTTRIDLLITQGGVAVSENTTVISTTPTQAEFNSLKGTLNALVDSLNGVTL